MKSCFDNCARERCNYYGTSCTGGKTVKGRWAKGEGHPQARLKEADVIEMRRLYFREGWTQQQIADKYGVSQSHAGKIINRISWGHVVSNP